MQDPKLQEICVKLQQGMLSQFQLYDDSTLNFGDRLCIPDDPDLKRDILEEAHYSSYIIQHGGTKMYR